MRRSGRERAGRFLVEGPQGIREALAAGAVREIFVTADAGQRHADLVEAAGLAGAAVYDAEEAAVAALAETVAPQGLVAVCDLLGVPLQRVLASSPRLLAVCAAVRDPGNAGTVIRCADAAGADAVVLVEDCVDVHNGKAVRASAGSLFHLPIVTGGDLPETAAALRGAGLTVLAADGAGTIDLDAAADAGLLDGPVAWVFGNEAWGMPERHRALADAVVRIPMHGRAESLNLGTAAAVCLYATARAQRRAAPPDLPLDSYPDAVVVVGGDGLVQAVNARARRLLRLPADVVGGPAAPALPLVDEAGNEFLRCTALLTSPSPLSGLPERPWWLPDGTAVLATARVTRGRDGAVARAVVALRTLAGRERHGRNQADLVATVAHELRSPLTGVKGFTGTLLARWDRFTDPQKRLLVEGVAADADRLGRLLTDLLDVARIESGRLALRRVPLDVGAAARRAVEALVVRGEPADRFEVDVDPGVGEVFADADQVAQALGNLLDNALKHGAGRVGVDVGPGALPEGAAAVRIVVHDEGAGVPDDIADRVFARFWRSGSRAGSGLGLYLVRGIVRAHGGTIALGRGPGGGAAFTLLLPAGIPSELALPPT